MQCKLKTHKSKSDYYYTLLCSGARCQTILLSPRSTVTCSWQEVCLVLGGKLKRSKHVSLCEDKLCRLRLPNCMAAVYNNWQLNSKPTRVVNAVLHLSPLNDRWICFLPQQFNLYKPCLQPIVQCIVSTRATPTLLKTIVCTLEYDNLTVFYWRSNF